MTTTNTTRPAMIRRRGSMPLAIGNEVVKGLRHGWAERTQILIELPLFVSFMILISFIVGQGKSIVTTGQMNWSLDTTRTSWLFVGLAIYVLVYLQVQKMFWRLLAEIQTGTLEQTYLSRLPSWVHTLVGRSVAATIEAAIVVVAMYVVTNLAVRLRLTWRPDALIPIAFVLIGSVGFSLAIAGLTLRWKRIEMFNDMVLLFVMFFSGAIISVDQLPQVGQHISPFLFITHVNAALRRIMLDNRSLGLWGTSGYLQLAAAAIGTLVVGVAIFRACEHAARHSGSLNRY